MLIRNSLKLYQIRKITKEIIKEVQILEPHSFQVKLSYLPKETRYGSYNSHANTVEINLPAFLEYYDDRQILRQQLLEVFLHEVGHYKHYISRKEEYETLIHDYYSGRSLRHIIRNRQFKSLQELIKDDVIESFIIMTYTSILYCEIHAETYRKSTLIKMKNHSQLIIENIADIDTEELSLNSLSTTISHLKKYLGLYCPLMEVSEEELIEGLFVLINNKVPLVVEIMSKLDKGNYEFFTKPK